MSFMGRIIQLEAALLARHYDPLDGSLGIICHDPQLPANQQPVTLNLQAGRVMVEQGKHPTCWIAGDIGTLTQLWSGAVTASQADWWGKLQASGEEALKLADRVFRVDHEPYLPEVDGY